MDGSFKSPSSNASELEEGRAFTPRFDRAGLIPAIVSDAAGGGVLMFAYMNAEKLTSGAGRAMRFGARAKQAAIASSFRNS